jgi:hypothetical protein
MQNNDSDSYWLGANIFLEHIYNANLRLLMHIIDGNRLAQSALPVVPAGFFQCAHNLAAYKTYCGSICALRAHDNYANAIVLQPLSPSAL